MNQTIPYYDVIIAGGGPAGLSAGLFTARYGLNTLILDRGKSSLKQCSYLDNYLGFPGGIEIPAFLELAHAHASEAGCQIIKERVMSLTHGAENKERFRVETRQGNRFRSDHFVAASIYDVEYLKALNEPTFFDAAGVFQGTAIDAYGRTSVTGFYLSGVLAGVENQALICAGQAAQTALGIIRDFREDNGLWEAIARYLDWQVWQGCYDGPQWVEQVQRYFRDTLPGQCDLPPEHIQKVIEQWMQEKRARQIDRKAVKKRGERGRRILAEHLERFSRNPDKDLQNEGDKA